MTGNRQKGPLGLYRELLDLAKAASAEDFATAVLEFDPFAILNKSYCDVSAMGCAMLGRLLKKALERLGGQTKTSPQQTDGWGEDLNLATDQTDGWGDLDLDIPDATPPNQAQDHSREEPLRQRLMRQSRRLQVLEALDGETVNSEISWPELREMDEDSLCKVTCLWAAKQWIPALEALFSQEERFVSSHWQLILGSLPETAEIKEVKHLLPVSAFASDPGSGALLKVDDATDWYLERALKIVSLTGLCRTAMDLLEYGICSGQGLPWPERSTLPSAKDLPELQTKPGTSQTRMSRLYGMFCLCEEYQLYLQACHQDMLDSGWPPDEPPPLQSLVRFMDFCELSPSGRLRLLLKRSSASTVVEDIHQWLRISPSLATVPTEEMGGTSLTGRTERLSRACRVVPKTEETLANALLGRLGSTGWDPEQFKLLAQVVQASSPALPRSERIIKDHTVLMEFIFKSVYSEDQRCHAADIFERVDVMYGCIPKPDSDATGDAESWAKFQKQADELEKHLTCVELLLKHKIKLSLSFADLRSGCSNENMAIHSMWNLFRVLGARYRPALFWRSFQQELFYLHTHAFAAVSMNSVYDMYVRCLVEQDHVEVMSSVVENWTLCCNDLASSSLVALAKELVNGSPSLRHAVLEKASRLLKCAPSPQAAEEQDFIKACELLHDLLWRKPKRTLRWVQSAVQDITSGQALAQLSEMRSNFSMMGQTSRDPREIPPDASAFSMEGFCIELPVQLRLRIQSPLRIVTDLLEFNPPILLESEDLQKFCSLIGLPPSSPSWAEVMALCGAAHLLCGDRAGEALSITEKLLVNKHPGAWKLAVALATDDAVDQMSAASLLADAARVCSEKDLPTLLSYLEGAPACRSQETEATLFPMDLDELGEIAASPSSESKSNLEAAWQNEDVGAAVTALVHMVPKTEHVGHDSEGVQAQAVQVANFLNCNEMTKSESWDLCADLLDRECPETEPDREDRVAVSSALRALCELCPDLDSALGGEGRPEELVQRLLKRASSSSPSESLALARAVAGVPELVKMGVTSSTIALHAAKALVSTDLDLGPLMFWLEPTEALQFLEFALDIPLERARTLEVIALLRFKSDDRLSVALLQAEALTLLRSTGKSEMESVNLRLHPELSMEEIKRRWLQEMAHLDSFLPIAETLLETGFTQ